MEKSIPCKKCNHMISSKSKYCYHCGAKLKHPARNVLLTMLCIIVGFIVFCSIIGGNSNDTTTTTTEETSITYIETTVKQMQNDLTENALAAKNKYNGQYVDITGYLQTIDADGNYISISNSAELEFLESTITCNIKSDTVRSKVASLTKNQQIVVRCYVTNVDELFGYTVKIIDIK